MQQTFTISSDLGFPWLPARLSAAADRRPGHVGALQQLDRNGHARTASSTPAPSTTSRPSPCNRRRRSWRRSAFPRRRRTSRPRRSTAVPRRRGCRDPRDRRAVDGGRRQRLRAHPRDPGPPERSPRSSPTTRPSRTRDDSYTILEFLTTTKRGFCQQFASAMAVMLRTLGFPSRVAIGLHPGTARSGHRRVPRHDERAPQLGRGAVPDVRLARVRAHARSDEPGRERVPAPRRVLPPRDAGMSRRIRWRSHGGAGDDRRSERPSSAAAEPGPAGALERARADAAAPGQHGRSEQARAGGEA